MWRQSNHRENSNHTRDTRFFSRGSRVCWHASPRCVDQHLVVRQLIGITHLANKWCRKNLPTSEVAQWHEQSNRVHFGSSLGEGQEPAQATNRGRRHSPTSLNDPPIIGPSRCRQTPRVTRSPPAQIAQLVPQDARTLSNALEALQSHSNDEIKCASEWIVFP
jgi:hypothetical protein